MKQLLLFLTMLCLSSSAASAQIAPTIDRGLVEIDNLTERAMDAIDNEDYNVALDFIRAQIKKTPKDPDPRCILGALMSFTDKPKQGVVVIDAAIKLFEPDDLIGKAKATLMRGLLRQECGDTVNAINDFTEAIAIDPIPYISDFKESRNVKWHPFFRYLSPDISSADFKVSSLFNTGHQEEALALQYHLIENEKDQTRLPGRYAKCMDMFYVSGDTASMLNALKLGLLCASDEEQYSAVASSVQDNMVDICLPVFADAMKEKPDDWILAVFYNAALLNSGRYSDALVALDKAIRSHPDHEESFLLLKVMAYQKSKDFEKALAFIDQTIEKYPDLTDRMLSEKVNVLKQSGDNENLSKVYDILIERSEKDQENSAYTYINTLFAKATLLRRMGNPEEAVKYYDLLIDFCDGASSALSGKADALMECGKNDEAKQLYRRILEIETDTVSESFRPYALQGLGRADESIEFLNKLIETDPSYTNYFYLACLYGRMADAVNASAILRRIIELFPGELSGETINDEIDFDPVRKNPEFEDLMNSLGIE